MTQQRRADRPLDVRSTAQNVSNDRVGRVDGSGGESDSKSVSTRRLDANLTGVSLVAGLERAEPAERPPKYLPTRAARSLSTTELPTTVMLDLVKAELAKFLTWSMVTGL